MRQLGLKGLPRRRLPRGAKLHTVTSLDLVGRQFRRDRPNELWVTDITEHSTREGKVYCCVVLDTFSRKVVGWSIDSTQTTSLVLNALGMATHRRPDRDGLVMHSDRGVQFTSWAFSHNLTQAGISPRGIARQRQQMRRVLDRSCRTASLAKPDGSSGRHSSESLRQIALTRPPRSAVHSLHCSDVSQSRRPSYHPAMTPIDFRRANAFISAVPTGRWTAYKDVAIAGGSPQAAQAIGSWLRREGDRVPHVYRVLRADGFVPDGFRPAGPGVPANAARVREVLRSEGVRIDQSGRAASRQRCTFAEWQSDRQG